MKTKFNLIIIIISCTLILGLGYAKGKSVDAPSFIPEKGYAAHEWGTFTTLSGSDGKLLSGLQLEEEQLPKFVYSHKDFSRPSTIPSHVLARNLTFPITYRRRNIPLKGLFGKRLKNVTVKMETPVLYFYSKDKQNITVNVNFNGGSISQWYPKRAQGETLGSLQKTIDFAYPTRGWVKWQAEILPRNTKQSVTSNKKLETPTWVAPRETDSNLLKVGNEIEKFLFYRGVGNFRIPLIIKANRDGSLFLENKGKDEIPYLFIYEKKDNEKAKVWWSGKLAGKSSSKIIPSKENLSFENKIHQEFESKLVEAGLYRKEAKAMLKTWKHSYFEKSGLKIFWILPNKLTDRILPIYLKPKPVSLKRVLVGRSEVLTPEFEDRLVNDFASVKERHKKWGKDRFYLAYLKRVSELTASVKRNQ